MSRQHTEMTEADLRRRWPAVFNDERKPLKLNIGRDMRITTPCPVLRAWVRHPQYLRRLLAGHPRYDLDGQPAGSVSKEQAAYARQLLGRLFLYGDTEL